MKINKFDISYTYDHFGYMMYYKEKPIGGAKTIKKGRRTLGNLKFYKEQAEITKRQILSCYIETRFKKAINKINKDKP